MREKKLNYIAYLLIILANLTLLVIQVYANDETDLFTEAESYFYSQNYQLAEESYKTFVKKYPLSDLVPDAVYKRAVSLYYLNQIDESLNLFISIEKRFRTTRYIDLIPFWKGVIYYKKNQCDLSLKNFNIFLQKEYNPNLTPKALLYSSLCYLSLKNYSKARERLEVLISKKGYSGLTPYEITLYGFVLLKNRDYAGEIEFQRKINLALLPDKYRRYIDFYRAEALWFIGKRNDAVQIYNTLMDSTPDISSVSFRRLYSYYQEKKDLKEMEKLLIEAEHRFYSSPDVLIDVWIKMGMESFKRGDYKLAQYLLLKAFDYSKRNNTNPSYIVPLYLSEIYLKNKDLKDALRILSEYENNAKDKKSKYYVLLHLGKLYFLNKDYESAINTYKEFLKLYSDSDFASTVNYLVAYLYYVKGDYKNALNYCNSSLKSKDEKFYYPSLKMKEILLRKSGLYEESSKIIDKYIKKYPDDISVRLDEIRVEFLMRRYGDVINSSVDFLKTFGNLNSKYELISVKYLYGLSLIALKKFSKAVEILESIDYEEAKTASLSEIYPYILYYRGWAYYRLGKYDESISNFSRVRKEENLDLWINSEFMIGWCLYQKGEYTDAGNRFLKIGDELNSDKKIRAYYLAAKSFKNAGKLKKAGDIFKRIIDDYKSSNYWDDSVFEYAMMLNEIGKPEDASNYYLLLFKEHPHSSLVDEALYRRAETLYQAELYRRAVEAFNFYRRSMQNGKMADASLYWEGMAWYKLGEKDKALKTWSLLVSNFKKSSYRADALIKIAKINVDKGNYNGAISYYDILLNDYPQYSKDKDIELLREKSRYLAFGYSEEEAELTAEISKGGGASTDSGREAMLKLAEMYISKSSDKKKLELAFQYLNRIIENGSPSQEATAYFLLGRYFEKKKDYYSAGKNYFNAAVRNKNDKEFFTHSVYNAAYNMKRAGYKKEAYALIQILENSYPESKWTEKAKNLLEN